MIYHFTMSRMLFILLRLGKIKQFADALRLETGFLRLWSPVTRLLREKPGLWARATTKKTRFFTKYVGCNEVFSPIKPGFRSPIPGLLNKIEKRIFKSQKSESTITKAA
jgi:hypothetical protein